MRKLSSDRKKVLKHHPDKKSSSTHGTSTNDDAFFKCIQKAMDVLTNPERRRQFDSVDPYYMDLEEDAPTSKTFAGLSGPDLERVFFRKFGPVFEREARFSTKEPVPLLGAPDAGKDEVEGFYNFWYNFDSWRGFEYLDKEVNEGSDSLVHSTPSLRSLLTLTTAAMTRGTRRRRTSRSAHAARRRTTRGCAGSSTLRSLSIRVSSASSRRRRTRAKRRRRPSLGRQRPS
jgi:DnaJ-class molecular chaperone